MNSIIDLHSYGHDIETTWLMDRGCESFGDDALTKKIDIISSRDLDRLYISCGL